MAYERALEPGERWLVDLRRRRLLWLLPLVAVAYFLWLLVVLSNAEPPVFPTSTWILLGTVLYVVIIAFEALLLVRTATRPVVYPGERVGRGGSGQAMEQRRRVPPPKGRGAGERGTVQWPKEKEQGGFYVTHHIRVGDDLVLAKRTFAVRPCAFCQYRGSCFEGEHFYARMDLPDDVTLERDEFLQMHGCTYGMEREETL